MRWFSATCVVAAFLFFAACSTFREEANLYACTGSCDASLDDSVFWCTTRANIEAVKRERVEQVFKGCMANRGYVSRNALASQTVPAPPIQSAVRSPPASGVVKKAPKRKTVKRTPQRSPEKKKPIRSVAKQKPKQKTVKRVRPARSQPSAPKQPAPKEFDPQDLFKTPAGPDALGSDRR